MDFIMISRKLEAKQIQVFSSGSRRITGRFSLFFY